MSKTVQNTLEKASHSLHNESETDMHYMVSGYIVPFCMFNSNVEKESVFDVIFLNLCFCFWCNVWFLFMLSCYTSLMNHSCLSCCWSNSKCSLFKHIKRQLVHNFSGICIKRNHFWKGDHNNFRNAIPSRLDSFKNII